MATPGILETLAYAIARGCTRAYFDVLEERRLAVEEVPNEDDRERALRMRAAVERVLRAQGQPVGPDGAAPRSSGG